METLTPLNLSDWITAIFTAALAAFTFLLWLSTHRMWKATKESSEVARDALLMTHRPKLIVRWIRLAGEENNKTIEYEITNVGGTNALVYKVYATIEIKIPPWLSDVEGENENLLIHGGQYITRKFALNNEQKSELDFVSGYSKDDRNAGSGYIYFIGYILYMDSAGITRRTSFCRLFHSDKKRFMPMDIDPEYEHVD